MKNKIIKEVISNVESILEEMDIDGMIAEYTDRKWIKQIAKTKIKDIIIEKVTREWENAIFKEIHKSQPIIDAFVADKVRGCMIAADKAARDSWNAN